jgi:hypothetical protein
MWAVVGRLASVWAQAPSNMHKTDVTNYLAHLWCLPSTARCRTWLSAFVTLLIRQWLIRDAPGHCSCSRTPARRQKIHRRLNCVLHVATKVAQRTVPATSSPRRRPATRLWSGALVPTGEAPVGRSSRYETGILSHQAPIRIDEQSGSSPSACSSSKSRRAVAIDTSAKAPCFKVRSAYRQSSDSLRPATRHKGMCLSNRLFYSQAQHCLQKATLDGGSDNKACSGTAPATRPDLPLGGSALSRPGQRGWALA